MNGFLAHDSIHNPDVLSCLANLSNDEVFTPPVLANQMLDLLPQKLFRDPNTTFLDPACKTGVFLREIAKRLMVGLAKKIPNETKRREHIFKKQLFGIAITELTALMSRRSVYCSKDASCKYSVVKFTSSAGNIRFKSVPHTWEGGKCKYCGSSRGASDRDPNLESHAYEFIHGGNPKELFNMHFDVIIGNPPYQMATAGDANGAQAKPIYQLFVEHAIKLEPRYITMITPSRWFAGGWGLDEFREHMRTSNHMRIIHDFPSARDCFSGVEIKGGVNYFLWDREWNGECIFVTHQQGNVLSQMSRPLAEKGCEAIIRYNEAIPILRKIRAKTNATFDEFVSAMKPFGLPTTFRGTASKGIKVFAFRREEWVEERDIPKNSEMVWQHKLFVPKAVGTGDPKTDWIHAVYAPPGTCCTETYLTIGPFKSEKEALNCTTYIETRFFHFLVTLQKHTQDCLRRVYSFVPMQDFTKPWTDEELYVKYGLTADEIAFIKSLIRPMEAGE